MSLFSWLKDRWRKEGEKDVCGVGFIRDRVDSRLTPACAVHDREYIEKALGSQYKSREQVDSEFLENMLAIARAQKSRSSRAWLTAKAYSWYTAVRVFGGIAWRT